MASNQANTVHDHIRAFTKLSRHRVWLFNPRGLKRTWPLELNSFDAVVLHYTLFGMRERMLPTDLIQKLRAYKGLKVQFVQDEYRWVDETTALARDVGVDVLFTAAPEPAAGRLYDDRLPGVERRLTLTGYVPDNLGTLATPTMRERSLHVGYRGRTLPFWLGRLTQEKVWIGEGFQQRAKQFGLRCDIGWREDQRIYGRAWPEFLMRCKATLGTESGASIADFDGSVEQAVRSYLEAHPDAPFEEVEDAVLRPFEGNVTVNVISPRVFEAACLRTALVMFPGQYSGVVEPGVHYIALEKDFSNMAEVAEKLKDDEYLETLVTRTYDDLVASGRWSLAAFIDDFDNLVEQRASENNRRTDPRYWAARGVRAAMLARPHRGLVRGTLRLLGSRRMAEDPAGYARKGAIALRAMLAEPALRRIFFASRSVGASLADRLEELLELAILRRALERRLPFGIEVVLGLNQDLVFVSVPSGLESDRPDDGVKMALVRGAGIVWDHRRVGSTISWNGTEVAIGEAGIERFDVVSRVAAAHPLLVAQALLPKEKLQRVGAG